MNEAQTQLPVLIIGGGIGGLCFALELAQRNIACAIFEQSSQFDEVGAGLQLSPNAVRRLRALGLGVALETVLCAPSKIVIHDAVSAATLNEIPLGRTVEERYGAPYWVVARQDLHSILLSALEAMDCVTLHSSKKFIKYSQTADQVTAHMADDSSYKGSLLVGADGVWSRVRHVMDPQHLPTETGFIAWRALINAETAPTLFRAPYTQVWLGPNSHLVQYRVSGGDQINLVAVTKGSALAKSWSDELPKEMLFENIRGFDKSVRRAVMSVENWIAWPLVLLQPFSPWHKGRVVLLGDAAHAVVPFLAQGAAMAIEDAALLGELIGSYYKNFSQNGTASGASISFARTDLALNEITDLCSTYHEKRFSRCKRVLSKSLFQSQVYHAVSYAAKIRNAGLKATPSSLLLRQYDWLYRG